MAYSRRNQPDLVLACAARAAEHWQNSTSRNKATAIQLRGHGYRLQEDHLAAIAAYREALEIRRSISPESDDVAIELNWLAGAEHLNKNYPAAERDYREALRIAKKVRLQELIAETTGNLAELALRPRAVGRSRVPDREALPLAEKVGRQELISGDCHCLAQALLKQSGKSDWQSDLQEALSMSRRAVEIFTRLRHPELQSAQETLEEIEKAMSGK